MRYLLSMIAVIAAINVSNLFAQETRSYRTFTATVAPVIETLDLSSYEYRPGDVITVTGKLFGEQKDRILTVYFYRPGGLMSFYMDLNVISWIGERIVAHVPGMDSDNFRSASDHYETSTALPANIKNYMSRYWVQGTIEIARKPDNGLSNNMPIRIGPETREGPVVRFIPKGQAEMGGSFWIYGGGFNSDAGHVFLKSRNAVIELKPIEHWDSTMIKVNVPTSIRVGEYELYVRDADGYESNKSNLDVIVKLESARRLEYNMEGEPPQLQPKEEPLEGTIPGERPVYKTPPAEGTVTPR